MSAEDLDEEVLDETEEMPEDLDEEDLEDLEDDDELDSIDDDDEVEDIDVDEVAEVSLEAPAKPAPAAREEDEEYEDDDVEDDDVEASLDVILKERLVVADDEDEVEDDEDVGDVDERGESPLRVLPKQPGEFVCQSCFLVKHPSQLADSGRSLCRDCV